MKNYVSQLPAGPSLAEIQKGFTHHQKSLINVTDYGSTLI